MKRYFRLYDPAEFKRSGRKLYMMEDYEGWTEDPAYALYATDADFWEGYDGAIIEWLPEDQQLARNGVTGLFPAVEEGK